MNQFDVLLGISGDVGGGWSGEVACGAIMPMVPGVTPATGVPTPGGGGPGAANISKRVN